MKYYFFRDLDNKSNLEDNRTFHAFGIVDRVFNESDTKNGKDLSVSYFNAFQNKVSSEWRAHREVEIFEVFDWEYTRLKFILNKIDEGFDK